jgi:hypothetical protein
VPLQDYRVDESGEAQPPSADRDHRRLASIAMEGTGKVKGMFQQSTIPNVAVSTGIPCRDGHIRLVAKAVLTSVPFCPFTAMP